MNGPLRPEREGGRVLPFRRRRFIVRHKRRHFGLGILRAFVGALAAVGMPVAAVSWASTAPQFEVRRVEVQGTPRVPAAWLSAALASLRGRNLFWIPLSEVRERVLRHPWVAAAEVRKQLPDRLEVRVSEREPAALWRRGTELLFVDAAGEEIATFAPSGGGETNGEDLILVSAAGGQQVRAGLALAARLGVLEPEWGRSLSEVEALSEEDYRLHIEELPFALLVTADRLEPAIADFRRWAPEVEARFGELATMDLRFPQRIVIEPVAPAEAEGGETPSPDPAATSAGSPETGPETDSPTGPER